MFWPHVAHTFAFVGLILTLWASLLQARRAIDKAAKAAKDDKRKRIAPKPPAIWKGVVKWSHDRNIDPVDFEVAHFRMVAGLWALILAASFVALGVEVINWFIDGGVLK